MTIDTGPRPLPEKSQPSTYSLAVATQSVGERCVCTFVTNPSHIRSLYFLFPTTWVSKQLRSDPELNPTTIAQLSDYEQSMIGTVPTHLLKKAKVAILSLH